MQCSHAAGLLEPYLDGELDRAGARELEAHVDGCAQCRAALERLGELRGALRDDGLRFRAPEALRSRIAAEARAAAAAPAAARRRRGLPPWTRLAAACVLAFGAGVATTSLLREPAVVDDAGALVAHDLFASHWRALAAATPVDVVSSDRHTVRPWFAGKVALAPPVRDFAEQGFSLVGGRIDYVGTQRVPVLVYRHGAHLADVFVLPATLAAPAAPVERDGYATRTVALDGQRAVLVSDMDAHESGRLAELLSAPR
jgi:anti-sigma factor RsiW